MRLFSICLSLAAASWYGDAWNYVSGAASSGTTYALQQALKTAGACPVLVKATNDFVDKSTGALATSVSQQLNGPCKDLQSEDCGAALSESTSELLLSSLESAVGLPAARALLAAADPIVKTTDTALATASCQIDVLKEAAQKASSHLPDDAEDKLSEVSDSLSPLKEKVSTVSDMLDGAKQVESLWDNIKGSGKKVFNFVAQGAMGELQKKIPEDVVDLAKTGGQKFVDEMTTTLKDKLGGALGSQMDQYCPDTEPTEEVAGAADSSLGAAGGMKEKIMGKLDDAKAALKKAVTDQLTGMLSDVQKKEPDEFTALKTSMEDCADAPGTSAEFQMMDSQIKTDFDNLSRMFQELPAAQHKHMAMLYLRTSALQQKNQALLAQKAASAGSAGLPGAAWLAAVCFVGVVLQGRRYFRPPVEEDLEMSEMTMPLRE